MMHSHLVIASFLGALSVKRQRGRLLSSHDLSTRSPPLLVVPFSSTAPPAAPSHAKRRPRRSLFLPHCGGAISTLKLLSVQRINVGEKARSNQQPWATTIRPQDPEQGQRTSTCPVSPYDVRTGSHGRTTGDATLLVHHCLQARSASLISVVELPLVCFC